MEQNASLQTVDKVPTNQLAESSNTDVSLNDLSQIHFTK